MKRYAAVLSAMLTFLCTIPALAVADSGYAQVQGAPQSLVATHATASHHSALPFTGLDVGVVLLVAAVLIAMGLVLRRTSHER
jgi:hypothetical protein